MNVITYDYNGFAIPFDNDNNIMVNATEMAKPFNKLPVHFLRNQSTKDYIKALENRYVNSHTEILKVKNGGANYGTWMHKTLALRFAQWLSPEFAVWVDERIEELLTTGKAELQPVDPMQGVLNSIKWLTTQIESKDEEIKVLKPKAEYCETVLESVSTFPISEIASELETTAIKLNRKLKELGIQYKTDKGVWLLKSKYLNNNYTDTYTYDFKDRHGNVHTKRQTVWTEKGRQFIHQIIKNNESTK